MRLMLLHDAIVASPRPDELDNLDPIESDKRLLLEAGHEVELLPVTLDLKAAISALREYRPDYVLNFVESIEGCAHLNYLGALVPELAGLPYSGCSSKALYFTTDKILTKEILQAWDLPFPAAYQPGRNYGDKLFIVKSRTEDASVGITQESIVKCSQIAGLIQERRKQYGGEWFAEEYIGGREFNLGLLADGTDVRILPMAEIVFHDYGDKLFPIVGYSAKWQEDHLEYKNSQRSFVDEAAEEGIVSSLKEIALSCWRAFQLSGYARVDFRVDAHNKPWILEINGNPGLDPESGFVAGCSRMGMPYPDLLKHFLKNPSRSANFPIRTRG